MAWKHGLREAPGGMDRCLTASGDGDSQLAWAEVSSKPRTSIGVGAFRSDASPCVADGNRSNTLGFLFQSDEVAAEENWHHIMVASSFQQRVGEGRDCGQQFRARFTTAN